MQTHRAIKAANLQKKTKHRYKILLQTLRGNNAPPGDILPEITPGRKRSGVGVSAIKKNP